MITENHFRAVAAHVIATLPESISERKRVLEALLALLPDGAIAGSVRRELLYPLNAHSIAQRELNLKLSDQANNTNDDDTHHSDASDGSKKS